MQFPGYEVIEPLYQGKRSTIYRAKDTVSQQSVILKVWEHSKESFKRIQHDFLINQRFDSTFIVHYLELKSFNNLQILVQEEFDADSLASSIPESGVSPRDFIKIAISLSKGLEAIHQKKIIHLNITPHHLLLNPKTNQVKFINFGQALDLVHEEEKDKESSHLEERAAYLAPEQTGRTFYLVDYRSDLYALGVVFYELLCGAPPFVSQDFTELIHCHLASIPSPPHEIKPAIPPGLSKLVMKLLEKTQQDRYQSAYGLTCDLEYCLQELNHSGSIASFSLGRQDVSEQFQWSGKLFGRQDARQRIENALEAVDQGSTKIVFVKGPAGIGKSTLIRQTLQKWGKEKRYFMTGKFDSVNQNTAYHGLIEAFQSLLRQILSESDESIEEWRDKIRSALGNNAQLLIDVIGDLEMLIGPQPSVRPVGLTESQELISRLFQRFVEVVASPDHILVLFLDDLQWADEASLFVLKAFITSQETKNFLWIGSYLEENGPAPHSSKKWLEYFTQSNYDIETLSLHPFDLSCTHQLIADALHHPFESLFSLAESVHHKTGGNPFFIKEFLKTL